MVNSNSEHLDNLYSEVVNLNLDLLDQVLPVGSIMAWSGNYVSGESLPEVFLFKIMSKNNKLPKIGNEDVGFLYVVEKYYIRGVLFKIYVFYVYIQ